MGAKRIAGVLTVGLFVVASAAQAEMPYLKAWTRQLGTGTSDYGYGVAVDADGNVYITGFTCGDLGAPNAGRYDAFLAKYDASGTLAWTRQLGSDHNDYAYDVAVAVGGNVYITGVTEANLGGPNAGQADAFLSKYDGSGTLAWTRQFGTGAWDYCNGVTVDADGNVYVTGYTAGALGGPSAGGVDVFLRKYDGSGAVAWTRRLGTNLYDQSYDAATDAAGNVYVTGRTEGSLGGPNAGYWDAFLAKYDGSGTLAWTRQVGTGLYDYCQGVAVDASGNAYITGYTEGDLGGPSAGCYDAFLAKYDGDGNLAWTRQIGSGGSDWCFGVAADAAGNAYITGITWGNIGGPNAGDRDIFLVKYDASGTVAWTRQLGTAAADWGMGAAVDAPGNVYITGYTWGDLGGPSAGSSDAFLAKYVVPEPATLLLFGAAVPLMLKRGRKVRAEIPTSSGLRRRRSRGRNLDSSGLALGGLAVLIRRRRR